MSTVPQTTGIDAIAPSQTSIPTQHHRPGALTINFSWRWQSSFSERFSWDSPAPTTSPEFIKLTSPTGSSQSMAPSLRRGSCSLSFRRGWWRLGELQFIGRWVYSGPCWPPRWSFLVWLLQRTRLPRLHAPGFPLARGAFMNHDFCNDHFCDSHRRRAMDALERRPA